MRKYEGTYQGMTGVKGTLRGPYFNSVTEALRIIKKRRLCSAAGDCGAITVWRDDKNVLRAMFSAFMRIQSERSFKSRNELRPWLKEWFPRTQRSDQ